MTLEYVFGEADAEDGVNLDASNEIYPIANLTRDILYILSKVSTIVGDKTWRTAPEHGT